MAAEARKKAADIIAGAESRSREIMKAAGAYCEDAMKRAEDALAQTAEEVKQSRIQFRQLLQEKPAAKE